MISKGDAEQYSICTRHLCHLFLTHIKSNTQLVNAASDQYLLYSKFEHEYELYATVLNITSPIPRYVKYNPEKYFNVQDNLVCVPYMRVTHTDNSSLIIVDTRTSIDDLGSSSLCQCYTVDDTLKEQLDCFEDLKNNIPEDFRDIVPANVFYAIRTLKKEILETLRSNEDERLKPYNYEWFENHFKQEYRGRGWGLPLCSDESQPERIIPDYLQGFCQLVHTELKYIYRSLLYNIVRQHKRKSCTLRDVLLQCKAPGSFTWKTADETSNDQMYTFNKNGLSCNSPDVVNDQAYNWYNAMGICLIQKLFEPSIKDVSEVIKAYNELTEKVKAEFTTCLLHNGFGNNPIGLMCARWLKENPQLFPAELKVSTYKNNFWAHNFVKPDLDKVPDYSWKNITPQRQGRSPYLPSLSIPSSSTSTEPPVFYEWLSEKIDNKIANDMLQLTALKSATFRVNTHTLDEFELNDSSAVIELYELLDIAKCRNKNYTTPKYLLRVLQYVEHLRDHINDPSLDIWNNLVNVDATVKTAVDKYVEHLRNYNNDPSLDSWNSDLSATVKIAVDKHFPLTSMSSASSSALSRASSRTSSRASNSVDTEKQTKWSKLIDDYKYTITEQKKQLLKRIIFNDPNLLDCKNTKACLDYLFEYLTYAKRMEDLRMRLISWTIDLYEINDSLCRDFYEMDHIQLRPSTNGKFNEVFPIQHCPSVYKEYEEWIEKANEAYQERIQMTLKKNQDIKENNRIIEEKYRKGNLNKIDYKNLIQQLEAVPRDERLKPYKLPKQYSLISNFERFLNRVTGVGARYVNIDSKGAFFEHFIEPLKTTVNVVDFIQYSEVCISDACAGKEIKDAAEEDYLLPTSLHGDMFLNTKDHYEWISMVSTSHKEIESKLHNLMRAVIMDEKTYNIHVRSAYILSCVQILYPKTLLDSWEISKCLTKIQKQPIRAQKHKMISKLLKGRTDIDTSDSANSGSANNENLRLLKDYIPNQSHIEHKSPDFSDSGNYFRCIDPNHNYIYIYAACQDYVPQFYITFRQGAHGIIQYQQNNYEILTSAQRSLQHLPFMAMIPYCVPYFIGHRNHNQYIVCIYQHLHLPGKKTLQGWQVYSVSSNLLTFEFKNLTSAAKGVRVLMALRDTVGCTPFLDEMLKGYQSPQTLQTHCLSRPKASDLIDVCLFDEVKLCIQRCYNDINEATHYFDALNFTNDEQLKRTLRTHIVDKYDEKGIDDSVLNSFCNDVCKCTFDLTPRKPLTNEILQTIVEHIVKVRNTLCTNLLTVYDASGFASMDTHNIEVCTNILILNTLLSDVYSLISLTKLSSDARDSRDLKLLCKDFNIYEHLWFGKEKCLQPSSGRIIFTGTCCEFLFQILFGFLVHKKQWETYTKICNGSQKSAQLYQFMMSRGKSSVISPLLVLRNLQTLHDSKDASAKRIGIEAIDPKLLKYLDDCRFDEMSLMEIKVKVIKDNVRWPWRSKPHTHDVGMLDIFNQQLENIITRKKQPPNPSMVYAIVPTQLTTQVKDGFCALQWYFGIGGANLQDICPSPTTSPFDWLKLKMFIDDVFYHKSPPIQYPPDTSHYGTLLTKSDADMKELFFEKEVDFFEKAVFLIDEFDSMYDPLQSNYNVVDEISNVDLFTNDHIKYIVYQSCKTVYTESSWIPSSIHVEGRLEVPIADFMKTFEQNNVSFVKFVNLQLQSVDSLEKNIQFGLTKDKDKQIRTRTAIPYLRKDTPMEGSSFSSEVITLALSTLYRCANKDDTTTSPISSVPAQSAAALEAPTNDTFEIRFDEYDLMFLIINCGQIKWLADSFLYNIINTVAKKKEFYDLQNVSTVEGMSPQHKELLRNCCIYINDKLHNNGDRLEILVKLVQNMNDFKVKKKIANMSFIDILGIRGLHFQTGFTGTVNVELVQYPSLLNINDDHRHFDANIQRDYDETLNVYTAFTECIDNSNKLITDCTTPEHIYEKVSTDQYHMLVDAVGVFKKGDNRHVIECIYNKDQEQPTPIQREYVYLTDKDQKKIFDVNDPLNEKECTGIMHSNTFFYYSQKHIVGIDFKQHRNMRGLLIVSKKTTYTNMAQAIYRARKLNQGHIMDIVVWPDEADESKNGTPTLLDKNTLYHILRDNDERAKNTRSDLLHAQTVKHIGRKWLSENASDQKKVIEKKLSEKNKSKYRLFRFIELIYQYCTSSRPPLHKKWYLETAHDPVYRHMTGVPPGNAGHSWLYKDLQAITVQFKHIIDQDESLRKQMTVSETDKSLDKMFFKQDGSQRSSFHQYQNRGGSLGAQRRSSRKSIQQRAHSYAQRRRRSLRKSIPQRVHSDHLPNVKDSQMRAIESTPYALSRLDRFEINGQWEVMKLVLTIKDWYTTTNHTHAQTIKDICDQHLELLNLVRKHSNSKGWYQKVCEHIVHTLFDSTDLEHKFYPWITEADFYREFKRIFSINANSLVALQAMNKRWSQLKADTKHTRRMTQKQKQRNMSGRHSIGRTVLSTKQNHKDQEREYIEKMGKFLIKEKTKIYSQDKTMRLCLGVTGGGLDTEQQQQQQQQKQVKRQVQLQIQKQPSKPWSFPETMDALALQTFNRKRALESIPEETIELIQYSENIDSVQFVTYKTSNGAYSYGTIKHRTPTHIRIYSVIDGNYVNIPRTDVQVNHRLVASYSLLHWDRRPFNIRNIERYVDRKMYCMLAPIFMGQTHRFWNLYDVSNSVMSWPPKDKGYTPLSDIRMVAIPCPSTGMIYWILTTAHCASYMPRRGFHFNVNETLTNGHYLTEHQKIVAQSMRIPRYFQQILNGLPAIGNMKEHTIIKKHYDTILTLQATKFGWSLNGYKYTSYTTKAIKALIKAKVSEFKTFQSNGYTNDCVSSIYYRSPYGCKVNINEFGGNGDGDEADSYSLFEKDEHEKKA